MEKKAAKMEIIWKIKTGRFTPAGEEYKNHGRGLGH